MRHLDHFCVFVILVSSIDKCSRDTQDESADDMTDVEVEHSECDHDMDSANCKMVCIVFLSLVCTWREHTWLCCFIIPSSPNSGSNPNLLFGFTMREKCVNVNFASESPI